MTSGAVVARIISQYSDKGTKAAIKDLKGVAKNFDEFGKHIKKAFEIAAAASAAFAIKIGTDSVKAAIADQQSQALLAHALKNTTGATNTQIAAVEEHIRKQMLLLGVSDNELRPSMISLTAATHDVTKAQNLQSLALDLAAGRGKDLNAVSLALGKAYLGNFTSLRKMGIPISENIIKTKDFNGLVKELTASVGGQAAVAANTFAGRMTRIQLSFEEAKKSLGYALLPVLEHFATILTDTVIPKVQAWVDLNKDKLAKGFQSVANFLAAVIKVAVKFGTWITSHMTLIKELGVILLSIWAAAKVFAFATALTKVVKAFQAIRAAAETAAVFEALATGGASLAAGIAAVAVLGLGTAWLTAGDSAQLANEKFTKAAGLFGRGRNANGGFTPIVDTKKTTVDNSAAMDKWGEQQLALVKNQKVYIADQKASAIKQKQIADQAAKDASAATKATASQIASAKALALLKKLGVVPTSTTDPIELEAARQNLVKQGNLAELAKIKAMQDNLELQKALNESSARYADILQAISNNNGVLSTAQIEVLAAKWGISANQVEEYVTRIYAANSTPANTDAVIALLQAWGMTKDEARKYIDFAKALGDQKLSDAEILKLMGAWGLSKDGVDLYAKSVVDGSVFGAAVLKGWASPGDAAAASWIAALNAKNAYMGGSSSTTTSTIPNVQPGGNTPGGVVIPSMPNGSSVTNQAPNTLFPNYGMQSTSGSAGTTVNVTVQGSVTAANDLASIVRHQILLQQQSGNGITVGALSL